jgi:hypothetical protein
MWEERLERGKNLRHEGIELVYRHEKRERYGHTAFTQLVMAFLGSAELHDRHRGLPTIFSKQPAF